MDEATRDMVFDTNVKGSFFLIQGLRSMNTDIAARTTGLPPGGATGFTRPSTQRRAAGMRWGTGELGVGRAA
ncbi:hypothetical protein [Streptomyces canus]|uniref:hypothetical protein n=1 Tax=Streptomyces canus TaxID=58343 RepID=UPI002DDA7AEC|nr:hypothetical protein [Streptomyces canus]WSD91505.1 hypothetical protein OG925_47620 [Streptomyces canus]